MANRPKPSMDDLCFIESLLSKAIHTLNDATAGDLTTRDQRGHLAWMTDARRDIREQIASREHEDLASPEVQ